MPQQCEKLSSIGSLSSKFSNLKVLSGGGASTVVLSGVDKQISCEEKTNVALKRLSLVGKGQCRVALRELRLLKRFSHENIIKTYKITDPSGSTIEDPSMENFKDLDSVYIVEELCDSDLYRIVEKTGKLPLETTKLFMYQLLRGLKYIHSANVIHRDIKPGNLFIKAKDLSLKIGDYGLARVFDGRYDHSGYLTALVSTRYYRAPEVMLNLGNYTKKIDIWSAGCVFGEMLLGKTVFSGENDLDQMTVICEAYGINVEDMFSGEATFPQHWFEKLPPEAIDLLSKLLCINPCERISAKEALQHPFFSELHDPCDEPICEQPFFIEHEIDNLPIKILKRKILRNSCLNICDKKSYHSSEENLFKDFDETFIRNEPVYKFNKINCTNIKLNSRGDESDFSEYKSSSCNNSSYESFTSHSSHYEHSYSISNYKTEPTAKETYIPSLMDAMSREELVDEPYRDPGMCERKYHESSKSELSLTIPNNSKDDLQSTYFSGLSPVIELTENSKALDEVCGQSFLEIPGHYCHDRAITTKSHHKFKRKTQSSKTVGQSMKCLNEEIIRKLSDRSTCQCSLEELLCSKINSTTAPVVHWDSLRFWI